MRRLLPFLGLLLSCAAFAQAPSQESAAELASRVFLWPGEVAPGSQRVGLEQSIVERSRDPRRPDRIVTGVTRPYLTVYRPSRPNGAALLVTPGGGYVRIVLDKEGTALAPVFAERYGYTLFVLRYRLPGEGHERARDAPLADAQRALRLMRANAARWKIDPHRIGVMGFSAGGHVAASLGTRFADPVYAPVDGADTLSARPDFMLLLYPVIDMGAHAHAGSRAQLLGPNPGDTDIAAYSLQNRVQRDTPPTFLLHADDDASVPVENSLQFHAALRRAGVAVEFHEYPKGGHGFGVREIAGSPLRLWPQLAAAWMDAQTTREH